MQIDTKTTDPDEALSAVLELLPQLGTAALHTLRTRTIPAVIRRRTVELVQRAGLDVEAGLLTVADLAATASGGAQLGIAEIDDTPGAVVPDHVAYADERDEDGDEVQEPTPLMDVRPVLVNEIDAE